MTYMQGANQKMLEGVTRVTQLLNQLTEEDYEESMIKKARINFRPGSALSSILGNLTFKKVAVKSSKEDKEAEEGGESEE